MQLEETASSKDVPPLSSCGVFELPAFVAQNNMRPVRKISHYYRVSCFISTISLPERNCQKSLV